MLQFRDRMSLNLQVVIVEYLLVPRSCSVELVFASCEDKPSELPVSAPRKGNKSIMMKFEKLLIYPGLIVKSLEVAFSNQLEQIAIAIFILG